MESSEQGLENPVPLPATPYSLLAILPLFPERADFHLEGPGAARLLVELPVRGRDGGGRHQQVRVVQRLLAPELFASLPHPGGLGQFLRFGFHLEALAIHQVEPRPAGICADFKNLPPDVCRHRHCHRQRPRLVVRPLGALAGQTLPPPLRGITHARPGCAAICGPGAGPGWSRFISAFVRPLIRMETAA